LLNVVAQHVRAAPKIIASIGRALYKVGHDAGQVLDQGVIAQHQRREDFDFFVWRRGV